MFINTHKTYINLYNRLAKFKDIENEKRRKLNQDIRNYTSYKPLYSAKTII